MSTYYEALYQKKMTFERVMCTLCPHYCVLLEGEISRCHSRINQGGTLMTTNYGNVASYAYDPIEKKPLNHFMPGTMIFSMGTTGCNLTCQFCQNHELVSYDGPCPHLTVDDVLTLATANESIGIAYTYNEPTVWYEFVLDVAEQAHKKGLKNVLVTNGYINPEPLLNLLPYIDALNIDLKSYTDHFYETICGATLAPVLKTIALADQSTHVEVTTLLIDTLNTSDEEISNLAKAIAQINPEIPLHLNRYFPAHQMTIPSTHIETLKRARDIAKQYLKNVHVGNCFIDD